MTSFERAMAWAQFFESTWARFDPVRQEMIHGDEHELTISTVEGLLASRPCEVVDPVATGGDAEGEE